MPLRFLIDNDLSHRLAESLREAGYDALHVRDVSMQNARDAEIFARASQDQRIIVAADTDFGTLLANRAERNPSVILFRGVGMRRPDRQAAVLLENLSHVVTDLEKEVLSCLRPGESESARSLSQDRGLAPVQDEEFSHAAIALRVLESMSASSITSDIPAYLETLASPPQIE